MALKNFYDRRKKYRMHLKGKIDDSFAKIFPKMGIQKSLNQQNELRE